MSTIVDLHAHATVSVWDFGGQSQWASAQLQIYQDVKLEPTFGRFDHSILWDVGKISAQNVNKKKDWAGNSPGQVRRWNIWSNRLKSRAHMMATTPLCVTWRYTETDRWRPPKTGGIEQRWVPRRTDEPVQVFSEKKKHMFDHQVQERVEDPELIESTLQNLHFRTNQDASSPRTRRSVQQDLRLRNCVVESELTWTVFFCSFELYFCYLPKISSRTRRKTTHCVKSITGVGCHWVTKKSFRLGWRSVATSKLRRDPAVLRLHAWHSCLFIVNYPEILKILR